MKCPNCQFENRDNAKFCKSCGYKLEGLLVKPEVTVNAVSVCSNCGAALKPDAKFCSKCGSTVAVSSVSSAPVPAPQPEPKTEILLPTPEVETQTEILTPKPAPIPHPDAAPVSSVCPNCGAVLKSNAKFCSKCGTMISSSAATPQPASTPASPPNAVAFCKNCGAPMSADAKFCSKCGYTPNSKEPAPEKPATKKNKPLIAVIIILVICLLLGGGFFALSKTGLLPDFSGLKKTEDSEKNKDSNEKTEEEIKEGEEDSTDDEDITAELEEKLAPIAEQVSAGEDKIKNDDYIGASSDLENALNSYAALVTEYDTQEVSDTIAPLADTAFELYTQSVVKQVEFLENQSPTAPLHKQIEITYEAASEFADKLKESDLAVSTDTLDEHFAAFPGRYKEKYITAFNDLITGEQWSRTTAWMYMQDAASVGLVDKSDPDDPLTLRYAYALAWFTQKETSEGRADGSLTDEEAIDSILVVAENADYNPVLMRELALCYVAAGDSKSSKIIQDACIDVRNYLANSEDIYINAEDLFVPGRNSNASSTIALNDFWYFNDFGDYSPSRTNGISPEGRAYVRDVYRQAISSL